MKLIIQIPCLNEEKTLPLTLNDLPKSIPGVDEIEILVINDGSTDDTVQVARENGVHHIVNMTNRKGLAAAFLAGLDASVKLGADIIVNTDGDNQYSGESVPDLIQPILNNEADMVIGDRQIDDVAEFSTIKKKLQHLGSWVVRQVSGTDIPDTTSGFRAFNREAALRLNVISRFTYTLETIIQAGRKNIAVTHVPIKTNKKLRESRLFKSIPSYIGRSAGTIFRIYAMYEPMRIFSFVGALFVAAGLYRPVTFLYKQVVFDGGGHVQSLILSSILIVVGFLFFFIGLAADLIAGNRRLTEDTLYRVKKLELGMLNFRVQNDVGLENINSDLKRTLRRKVNNLTETSEIAN